MNITSSSSPTGDVSSSNNNNSNEYHPSERISLPSAFSEDPAAYLNSISSQIHPSPHGLSMLAGSLSKWFQQAETERFETRNNCNSDNNNSNSDSNSNSSPTAMETTTHPPPVVHPATHVAHLYLCAAAKQLGESSSPGGGPSFQSQTMVDSGAGLAPAMTKIQALAAAATGFSGGTTSVTTATTSREQQHDTKHINETLEAVGAAAVLCPDRSAVASSGILPVLAQLLVAATGSSLCNANANTEAASGIGIATQTSLSSVSSSKSFPPLTQAHTAFLQCAVVAEQYEFAARIVRGTWPIPTSISLEKNSSPFHIINNNRGGRGGGEDLYGDISTIKKYYYLRGIVHYGCGGRDHYAMAHRCWWTCLSIPLGLQSQRLVGAISIQAWKKLTLVQPLLETNTNVNVSVNVNVNANTNRNTAIDGASTTKKQHSKAHNPPTRLPKLWAKAIGTYIKETAALRNTERDRFILYTILGPAVAAGDRTTAENLVREHESILVADGNTDMAQNCLSRAKELQVRKASKIFSVTSLRILARRWRVTPQEASQQLEDATHSGAVLSRVEADGTVVFSSQKTDSSAIAGANNNWVDLREWMVLLEKMQHMDVAISMSSKYHSLKKKKGKSGVAGDAAAHSIAGPRGVEEFYGNPSLVHM